MFSSTSLPLNHNIPTGSNLYAYNDWHSTTHDWESQSSLPPADLSPAMRENDNEGTKRRRKWTREEDEALRSAIATEHPDGVTPYKWMEISNRIPGRSNKDCRKRWYNTMFSPQALRGTWLPQEDALLVQAVKKYGTNWSAVATMVMTRKSCQCARRWYDTLDPSIDKAPWTTEEEELLMSVVNQHGRKWAFISKTYFPRRTALATKNRFVTLISSASRRHNNESGSQNFTGPAHIVDYTASSSDEIGYYENMSSVPCLTPNTFLNAQIPWDSRTSSPEAWSHGDPLMADALTNLEYELLSSQSETTSWSPLASPVSSAFPATPISTPPMVPISLNPVASKWAAGSWDPWDPEIIRLLRESQN